MSTERNASGPATDPIREFFTGLASRGRQQLPKRASGTLRCDLVDRDRVEHWYVSMTDDRVAVSRRNAKADAVIRVDRALFEGMVTGRVNATAAVLRGLVASDGDVGIVILFQRLFPGPPAAPAGAAATVSARAAR
jgi:SCP-2 sterol transfer family